MNEENTRAELIEPLLEQAGNRNFPLTKIDRAKLWENYSKKDLFHFCVKKA